MHERLPDDQIMNVYLFSYIDCNARCDAYIYNVSAIARDEEKVEVLLKWK